MLDQREKLFFNKKMKAGGYARGEKALKARYIKIRRRVLTGREVLILFGFFFVLPPSKALYFSKHANKIDKRKMT